MVLGAYCVGMVNNILPFVSIMIMGAYCVGAQYATLVV